MTHAALRLRLDANALKQNWRWLKRTAGTATGAAIEGRTDPQSEPLRHGPTGRLTFLGGVLSGPVPLALRLLRKRRAASVSTLVGSLITRFAWVAAGKASARDPLLALRDGRHDAVADGAGVRHPVGE